MRAFRKWTVVVALLISIATPWTLLQSVAWFGMFLRFSQVVTLDEAISMTFDGKHPCQLCKVVRQAQQEERQKHCPGNSPPEIKFELALPPAVVALFHPQFHEAATEPPGCLSQRAARPPAPPPRFA